MISQFIVSVCVCVCVRACVRACVRVCVCMWFCSCLIQRHFLTFCFSGTKPEPKCTFSTQLPKADSEKTEISLLPPKVTSLIISIILQPYRWDKLSQSAWDRPSSELVTQNPGFEIFTVWFNQTTPGKTLNQRFLWDSTKPISAIPYAFFK